jgi:serine protease inhibitor
MIVYCFPAAVFMLACLLVTEQQQFVASHPFVFVIKNIELRILLFVELLSLV